MEARFIRQDFGEPSVLDIDERTQKSQQTQHSVYSRQEKGNELPWSES